MTRCKACGKEFIKSSNRQVYCCKDCKKEALRQQWRNASHTYYHKHKDQWGANSVRRYGMGTGKLGPHRTNSDDDAEHLLIIREMKRLRIKTL